MKPKLTIDFLCREAASFARKSSHEEDKLYGVTDGKAIGTYLEHKFQKSLSDSYEYDVGSSTKGIDFPGLDVDMKVTSIKQPQSPSPFKSAKQKILGLGYSLLIFVYQKVDHHEHRTGQLCIVHTLYVDKTKTADYQTTKHIRTIIENEGNIEDLIAFMEDRNLPIDDVEAVRLAKKLLNSPPELGYLTISNALQWRLQYKRIIENAGEIDGIIRLT